MSQSNITVNQGTQTPIATDSVSGTQYGIIKLDMGAIGGTNPFTGTIPQVSNIGTLPNLPGGSIAITSLPNVPGGTVQTNILSGTLNSGTVDLVKAGTITSLQGGTVQTNILTGTIQNSGTTTGVGTVTNLGSVTNVGQLYNAGTVQNQLGGTLDMLKAGTISSLPNIPGGSISVTTGTINIGTMVGKDANAVAQTGNPLSIGGTDSGGTVRTALVNSAGAFNIGTITTLPNVPQGSINVTAGTVSTGTINTGTINLGTMVGKDANAVAQTANPIAIGGTDSGGTIRTASVDNTGALKVVGASAGTFVNLSTGTLTIGTLVGKDANAVAQTGNPIALGGTDSGGTIRTAFIDSAGAVKVSGASAGTFVNLTTGTLNAGTINIGTVVGKDANAAAQVGNPLAIGGTDSGGTIRTIKVDSGGLQRIGIDSGTISVLPNLPQGSITVTSGTIAAGTINTGTINLGTVIGKDANAAAQTGNPVAIGGTDSGGTVRTVLVNSAGAMAVSGASSGTFVNLSTGTLNVGTINTGTVVVTVGTVGGAVANAVAQSGNPLSIGGTDSGGTVRTILVDSTGVQRSSGSIVMTVGTVTVLPNLPQGSINVTAGTINTGTITAGSIVVTVGTFVGNGGSISAYGPAAAAAAAAGNPLNIGGTDSGGTIRTIKVDSGGLQRIGIDSGTISVLPNLPQGSINVTAGTMIVTAGTVSAGTINTGTINLGTMVGKDVNAAAQSGNPIAIGGTDSGGTIRTAFIDSAGAVKVSGASAGTFVNLTTGTLNAGTINAGTINTGTINLGTMVGKDANAAAQTGNPIAMGGTDVGGTIRTAFIDSTGAVKVAGASAGTFVNLTTGTLNSGTIDLIKAGTIGYAEGTTIGTITAPAMVFRETSGTLQVVGTAHPLPVSLQTLIAGEDLGNNVLKVEERFSSSFINAIGTTTVKSSAGFIHTLCITGGSAGTVTVYDGIGTSAGTILQTDTTNNPICYTLDVATSTGITIATLAATKVTTSYR